MPFAACERGRHREPFRELVPQLDKTITPAIINNTSAITYLRKYALGARRFRIMQNKH
jgi:putative restriction endonuclease